MNLKNNEMNKFKYCANKKMLMNKKIILMILILAIIISGCATKEPVLKSEDNKATGGVTICGADYPCGAQDNVCPENYGASCKVEDADCNTE
jgi:hypothetical protein